MVHTCRELRRTPQVSFAQKGQDLQELIDIMDRLKIPADKRPWLGAGGMLVGCYEDLGKSCLGKGD